MRILAVDLGDSRTGTALCNKSETLASPHIVLRSRGEKLQTEILKLAEDEQAEMIVVGFPKNMDGSEGPRAQKSAAFVKELEARTEIPVVLWDERLTTVSATYYLNETNVRGKERKNKIDALAAAMILEGLLSYRRQKNPEND